MRIGTRGSHLALWQARHIQARLEASGAGACELVILKTQGDRIQNVTFDKLEGKGFFTSELEQALLREEVDLAVHSLKDLPTEQPERLTLGAIPERANPADVLLVRPEAWDAEAALNVKPGSVVGTSSSRRRLQLLDRAPSLDVQPLRGNVPTRLTRLLEGKFGAIVLAAAGLERLELLEQARREGVLIRPLSFQEMVPAPGQGALGLQCRASDSAVLAALGPLHDPETAEAVELERRLLAALGGGCQMPLGALARKSPAGGVWELWAAWAAPVRIVRFRAEGEHAVERVASGLKSKAAGASSLEGRAVWITGGSAAWSGELEARLRRRGMRPSVRPLLRVEPLEAHLPEASAPAFDVVFLSSRTAIRRLAELLARAGHARLRDYPPLAGAAVAVMGPGSAREAREALGVEAPDFQAEAEGSGDLARRIAEGRASGGQALVARALEGRTELQEHLRERGWEVVELDLYRTEPEPLPAEELAAFPEDGLVILASPSAASVWLAAARPPGAHGLIAIGPTTEQAILLAGGAVLARALEPTAAGVEEALLWAPTLDQA